MENLRAVILLRQQSRKMGRKCHLIDYIKIDPDVMILTYEIEPWSYKDENHSKEICIPQTRVAIYTKARHIGSFIIDTKPLKKKINV